MGEGKYAPWLKKSAEESRNQNQSKIQHRMNKQKPELVQERAEIEIKKEEGKEDKISIESDENKVMVTEAISNSRLDRCSRIGYR